MKNKMVLLIEDEPSIAELCQRVLETEGNTVTVAADGLVAQEFCGQSDYDLIICDIRLPKQNGIDLYKWLIDTHPEKADKVLFSTGSVMGDKTLEFLNACGRPYILKPFRPDELLKVIEEHFPD